MKYIYLITMLAIFSSACKKDKTLKTYASVNVVNAVVNSGAIKVNSSGKRINWSALTGAIGTVNYGENQITTIFNFSSDFPIEIVPALDTTKNVFSEKMNLQATGIYSIFTTGQSPNFDSVIINETNIDYNFVDSAIAIRFINLSPNSRNLNITLANNPSANEIVNLSFKQVTEFKKYSALKIIPLGSLTFQVRDANSNLILTSYTVPTTPVLPYSKVSMSLSRFKSITLAIKGIYGTNSGVSSFSLFPIAHY